VVCSGLYGDGVDVDGGEVDGGSYRPLEQSSHEMEGLDSTHRTESDAKAALQGPMYVPW